MRLRRKREREQGAEDEGPSVNLTPLIDVVFVVLIMFILIAPVLEIGKVELAEAGADAKDVALLEKDDSPVTLHVEKDDSIFINKMRVRDGELDRVLREAKRNYPKAKPLVFHDRKASFGTYQRLKNALESAGFEEMDIVLSPSKK
ncbi:ExbD/TolR family protein [Estrella lausannensis]|uniref:Biopolymer transport protein TolR n=1 Tax=Estrella lausannensis TaxID=483423 RepID=A0A0H5DQT2_9BACT|nr:biopolymer transporter ExbD [Estrella lausannensis]CRX38907.1 Biopolymer transport protein TolR [Estrella lausannensis]